MPVLDSRPENLNFLSQVGFKFYLERAANFNYFIQKVNFPGITINPVIQETPFIKAPLPGNVINYDNLSIVFKIDEDFRGYFELYDWFTSLARNEDFDQSQQIYNKNRYEKDDIFSEGSLIILNSNMSPNIEITFQDMIPVSLSGFSLESDTDDITYITARLELAYRSYKYNYVT